MSLASFGSHANGFHNARICPAAANIALHSGEHFFAGRFGILLEQSGGRHDHASCAVTALHGIALDEGRLDRMQFAVLLEAFDGGNLLARAGGGGSHAGTGRRTIQQHGASATLALTASVFRSGEQQLLPQDPKQHLGRIGVDHMSRAVDCKFHSAILRERIDRFTGTRIVASFRGQSSGALAGVRPASYPGDALSVSYRAFRGVALDTGDFGFSGGIPLSKRFRAVSRSSRLALAQ